MTDDTIDPPVEPTLLEQFTKAISEDPQFQEASTGKGSVVVGMKKQETAREFALRLIATDPKWKLAPDSDEIIGIPGVRVPRT
jgi:hypothetical protein